MTTVSRRRSAAGLAASLAAVSAAAGIGGAATATSVKTWYPTLDRPSWRPPDEAFGPVWTVLYAANAVSAWLVWRADPTGSRPALNLYGAQLALNAVWPLSRRPLAPCCCSASTFAQTSERSAYPGTML